MSGFFLGRNIAANLLYFSLEVGSMSFSSSSMYLFALVVPHGDEDLGHEIEGLVLVLVVEYGFNVVGESGQVTTPLYPDQAEASAGDWFQA